MIQHCDYCDEVHPGLLDCPHYVEHPREIPCPTDPEPRRLTPEEERELDLIWFGTNLQRRKEW
jgi:hypothetical protein